MSTAGGVAPAGAPPADAAGVHADTFSMPANPQTTPSGLQYTIDRPGNGAQPQVGDIVRVHYSGWTTDGTPFDTSRDGDPPLEFTAGRGRMIKGFDESILAMNVGARRTVLIPPALGYGARGMGRSRRMRA